MRAAAVPNTRMALTVALGLHVVWVLVTYLLEGRIQTFLRPEAMGARLFYALVANILIGIGGSALVIRFLSRAGTISTEQAGFRGFGHAAFAIIVEDPCTARFTQSAGAPGCGGWERRCILEGGCQPCSAGP